MNARAAARPPARRPKSRAASPPRTPRAALPLAPPGDLRRAALVLAAIWAVLFAPQLFGARVFVFGDTSSIRAFSEFAATRWHEDHQRTHWNPYIFGGMPGSASLQDSRPQWLPDPLLDAFDGLHRLPGFPPLAIPLLVHLAGMIATAALARRLWSAGTPAMVWAGAAWGLLPGQLVPLAFGQEGLVMCTSLMPIILLAVARCAAAETIDDRLASGLGLALATFAQFHPLHAQIIAFTLPLAAAFAIERLRRGRQWSRLAWIFAFAALGVVMAAAVWWPVRLYTDHSVRGGAGISISEVATWSAGLPDLVALAWPWAAGFGTSTYWGGLRATDFPQFLGSTVLVLGLLGLLRRDGAGRAALLLVVAALVAALVSLGIHLGSFYRLLYEHVPLVSAFRTAVRTLIVAQLAFALLSARGFELVAARAARAPRRWLAAAGWTAGAVLVIAALLHSGFLADVYASAARAARPRLDAATALGVARTAALDLGARGLMVAALLALFALGAPGVARWRPAAVVAVLLLDLGLVSVPFLVRATGLLEPIEHPPAPLIARRAAADPTTRALDLTRERIYSNDWIRWRARSLTGNHSAAPREGGEVGRAAFKSYGTLCALSVRWLGGMPDSLDSTRFRRIAGPAGETVWEVRGTLPRAHAVPAVERLGDEAAVLRALAAPEFDPRAAAYTAADRVAGAYPGSAGSRIRWVADDPDHLELAVAAAGPAFLVVSDTWLPGWRAAIDGRAAAIHRVNGALRGIAVPAGTHRLRLDYEPEGWAAGVRAAWTGWALWLAGAGLVLARRIRRGRSGER